ncbi:hypothetical protein [Pseudomonas lurida]|uniref:hypothetical protein n=1 Tax=Pseudomonas lurida TaxID=244566 RepID=UPI0034D963A4
MSIFTAIANFKIAFLEALIGNHSSKPGYEQAKPQRPDYGNCQHPHRPHTSRPGYPYAQPAKPIDSTPHPHRITGHHASGRPVFSLSR